MYVCMYTQYYITGLITYAVISNSYYVMLSHDKDKAIVVSLFTHTIDHSRCLDSSKFVNRVGK